MLRGKVETSALVAAGVHAMAEADRPLTLHYRKGKVRIYKLPNGETARLRTCNDHILITVADSTDIDAAINIEGTDWLMIVMPKIPRVEGDVFVYLVPTDVAVEAVRKGHQSWLDSNPNTDGNNVTWNLWFETRKSKIPELHGFHEKWKEYLIDGTATTTIISEDHKSAERKILSTKDEIEIARQRIAAAAGVRESDVKITVDFGG